MGTVRAHCFTRPPRNKPQDGQDLITAWPQELCIRKLRGAHLFGGMPSHLPALSLRRAKLQLLALSRGIVGSIWSRTLTGALKTPAARSATSMYDVIPHKYILHNCVCRQSTLDNRRIAWKHTPCPYKHQQAAPATGRVGRNVCCRARESMSSPRQQKSKSGSGRAKCDTDHPQLHHRARSPTHHALMSLLSLPTCHYAQAAPQSACTRIAP